MASGKNALILFYELKGQFPEIPDDVLDDTMKQCKYEKDRCIHALKEEKYLFNQQTDKQTDGLIRGVKNIQIKPVNTAGGYQHSGSPSPRRDAGNNIVHSISMPAIAPNNMGPAHGANDRNSPYTAPVGQNDLELFMHSTRAPDSIQSITCATSYRGSGSAGASPQSASPGEQRRQVPVYHYNTPPGRPTTPIETASVGREAQTYKVVGKTGSGGVCTVSGQWPSPGRRQQSPEPSHQRAEATIYIGNKNIPDSPSTARRQPQPTSHGDLESRPPPPRPHPQNLPPRGEEDFSLPLYGLRHGHQGVPLPPPPHQLPHQPQHPPPQHPPQHPSQHPPQHQPHSPQSYKPPLFVTLTSTCTAGPDKNQTQVTYYPPERPPYYPGSASMSRYQVVENQVSGVYPGAPQHGPYYPNQNHGPAFHQGVSSGHYPMGYSPYPSPRLGAASRSSSMDGEAQGMVIAQETDAHIGHSGHPGGGYPLLSPASSPSSLSSESSIQDVLRRRSGSIQEEQDYATALLHHQRNRLQKIKEDLSVKKQVMEKMRREVKTMEKNMFEGRNARRNSFPKAEDVYRLRENNKRLQINIQAVMNEIDLLKHGLLNSDPMEQQNFYKNMPTGQRNSIYSQPNVPPPLPPRLSTVPPAPPPQPPTGSGDSEEGEQWPCSACTLLNHPALNKCECCEMPRVSLGS